MKTLSVKQPWAYLLCAGIKDIENRTWKTNYRGRVFIHAGMSGSSYIFENRSLFRASQEAEIWLNCDYESAIPKGAIIGSVEIVDCVLNHESIWAEHKAAVQRKINGEKVFIEVPVYNWVIANPIMFANPWLNIKGKLGLWEFENMKGFYDTTLVRK